MHTPPDSWRPGRSRTLFTIVALLLSACASSDARALPEEFLGRWYYTGSSGGMDGSGMGDEATGYIVIGADNSLETYAEDGALLERSEFTVAFGETIFAVEPHWILDPDSMVPRVVRLYDDGRILTISDNVYDGFSRGFARSR